MRTTRYVVAATLLLALTAGPASATHTHVRVLGSGQCVILAESGGEDRVDLPDAVFAHNPQVDATVVYRDGRQHPLHVLVHIAGAGSGELYVQGSAADLTNCSGYVNG